MTDRPTNDELEALIAGDRAGALGLEEAADLALMAKLLADPSTWAEPDPALEDAVVRAVSEAEPENEPAVPSEGPAPIGPTAIHSRPNGRRWRGAALSILAVAAAVVIVLGIVVATRNRAGVDFRSQLTATAIAPGANGSAAITHNDAGFRIVLNATGLPALPGGQYYQAWLKNTAGTLVPIGTFSSSDGRITLWSGVSPVEFHTITVTIEAADNVQASSGRRVLTGEVEAK
jgi:Anti-sigma-K factor rskA